MPIKFSPYLTKYCISVLLYLIGPSFGCGTNCWDPFFFASCLKTINSKKYGVDLVCFTSHPTTVIYSSKNGWDGKLIQKHLCVYGLFRINLFMWLTYSESLRLLSLHDNKYLRYFKGHHDRLVSHTTNVGIFFFFFCHSQVTACIERVCVCDKRTASILVSRVASLSLCSRKECFISGSLDRTVLLWDQRAEKCQVDEFAYKCSFFRICLLFNWVIYYLRDRVFYVYKEGLLHHTMNKGSSLQLHLEDTSGCLMLANMKGLVSICKSMGVLGLSNLLNW